MRLTAVKFLYLYLKWDLNSDISFFLLPLPAPPPRPSSRLLTHYQEPFPPIDRPFDHYSSLPFCSSLLTIKSVTGDWLMCCCSCPEGLETVTRTPLVINDPGRQWFLLFYIQPHLLCYYSLTLSHSLPVVHLLPSHPARVAECKASRRRDGGGLW